MGTGAVAGYPVLLALTDGHQRGGTVGVAEAGMLTRLTAAAGRRRYAAILWAWDTGGVRVEEGPVALATVSAVGTALARLGLLGTRLITVISGPRGCFGAPAVVAGLAETTIMTATAHWGLTGPRLLEMDLTPVREAAAWNATSARHRRQAGHADVVVPDAAAAIRRELERRLALPPPVPDLPRSVATSAARVETLRAQLGGGRASGGGPAAAPPRPTRRQRDLLRFSFRGHWRPIDPMVRRGLVHAAWGQLDGRPALGIIVGPGRGRAAGVGIDDASAVTEMVRFAVGASGTDRAPILTFLFCQGHAVDLEQERAGLPCALAETLKSLVAARLMGHPVLCVLGGAAYGAAYLSLAAPSHRVLAIRGTSVAPMAPEVLAAFRRLRGMRRAADTPPELAEHIPQIRMVESVVRLPRILRQELEAVRRSIASAAPVTSDPSA